MAVASDCPTSASMPESGTLVALGIYSVCLYQLAEPVFKIQYFANSSKDQTQIHELFQFDHPVLFIMIEIFAIDS